MTKKYAPKTAVYRELLRAAQREMKTLSYGVATARLDGAGELLMWLESRGRLAIEKVTGADLEDFLTYLKNRPSRRGAALSSYTINGYVYSIRLLFDYAERHGLRGGNPVAGLVPTQSGQVQSSDRIIASREEITRLYAAAAGDGRATALLHLLYGGGLRRAEAIGLNVGDIDYRAGLLYVRSGKNGKRRVIPLTGTMAAELKAYHKQERWYWAGPQSGQAFLLHDRGGRMRGGTIEKHLKVLVDKAGIGTKITPHGLRHSVATQLIAGGMDLERVRDFLGHAHLDTTQRYTRVKAEEV